MPAHTHKHTHTYSLPLGTQTNLTQFAQDTNVISPAIAKLTAMLCYVLNKPLAQVSFYFLLLTQLFFFLFYSYFYF